MSRRAVKIKIVFLDIFAVIAFAISQSEKPLFDDRILAIPECKSKTEILLVVGKTGDAVFAPAICAGARMVMRKVVPGISRIAVILPHSSPLPLTKIRTPALPVFTILNQAFVLDGTLHTFILRL